MANENVTILKKQRSIIKASCTRTNTYANSITSVTSSVAAQLEERKLKLDQYWLEYNAIQSQLEVLDENEANDRVAFEEAYYTLSAKIRELLGVTAPSARTAIATSPSNVSDTRDSVVHVRLPKLNLPTFSGKYDEWFPFFDAFNSIIHSNMSLSNVQKLQYLRASLSSEASDVISSLEISDLNYEVAWRVLRERYDNKRVIVHTHIRAIMELPSMARENSSELRQIADGASKHIRALQALKRPTSQWDDILVYILSTKLDTATVREWQSSLIGTELPTLKQLIDFITHRCYVLEATSKSPNASVRGNTRASSQPKRQSACTATIRFKCSYCQGNHSIYKCKDFLALSTSRKKSEIRNRKLCTNCLRSTTHVATECPSGSCKTCKAKHNTLLHTANTASSQDHDKENHEDSVSATSPAALVIHASHTPANRHTMLSTALVQVYDKQGERVECRALLDCGSQVNFISKKLLTKLGLRPRSTSVSISGINGVTTTSTQTAQLKLQSRISSYSVRLECIVTDQVTGNLPAFTLAQNSFDIPRNLELADPRFYKSAEIDILLGAEVFWDLLCVGQVQSSSKHPTLQKTRLGWILAGRISHSSNDAQRVRSFHAIVTNSQLHEQLTHFWQQEGCGDNSTNHTLVEAQCERHFLNTVSRDSNGRFIVTLPIKEQLISKIGHSRDTALKRLINLERRFKREPNLKTLYADFMSEYLSLGHMKAVEPQPHEDSASFYLPHHCVFKASEQPPRIRVVFDASCKSSTGISLNDVLSVGPVVQQDLLSILLRFRTHRYAVAADIVKMYRQILIEPSQTKLQRILWRGDLETDIKTYELTTVTYGTSSASYLATRCLKYLAEQHASTFPVGAKCVERDFYVDDLLTGADTITDAKLVIKETAQLLRLGSFELSKWASNCPQLLANVNDKRNRSTIVSGHSHSRVLGTQWDHSKDVLYFFHEADVNLHVVSKRTILSEIATLFDPLGLLGPIIVVAKIILQELWQAGYQWDESVPQTIQSRWLRLKRQLSELNRLRIPRCVKFASDSRFVQIHGFCDASQRAYGACIYVRTESINEYRTELLCSKSRVAPLKATSLPRLELSAAVLLARLLEKIRDSFDSSHMSVFLWSDSTIALNWLTSPSRRWTTFVANRVGEIQRLTEIESWRHISSADNPADALSRGLEPYDLINASLWWQGPAFLRTHQDQWPSGKFIQLGERTPEARIASAAATVFECSVIDDLTSKFSNLNKICRILAYCLRFRKTLRPSPPTSFVSHNEISHALEIACRAVQKGSFPREYQALSKGKSINASSKLLSLSPFIDANGLIRVGGRLKNSDLQFDTRHPILLPREHDLTKRVISHEHVRNMHAGTQATMAFVRQRFWPLALRSSTRKILKKCIACFRAKPRQSEAIMGSLPVNRVTVSRPFSHCGVDYAGPVMIREGKRRNARNSKAYISIFVCFATKAVHIELVSDLTSDAFISAFRRFISRRGRPACMYSDNGSTFVGAHNQLKEVRDFLNSHRAQADIRQFLCEQETTWNFIPPNAPHFGGLWEAAVKAAKYHMARIIGSAHLTFEEIQTVLAEVEAILNSRPLTQLSSDPSDLAYLSPGHFLVGTAMNGLPCRDLCDINENRLTRWQRVNQIRQHFWKRWSTEYLHSLQERSKWKVSKGTQLKPGQLVLIMQPGLAPMQWALGRVQEIHAGSDGVVRSATIRTVKGSFVRPLSKLAILPVDS